MANLRPVGLGLESGGTGTRWCLASAGGETIAAGTAAPITGHLFAEAEKRRTAAILDQLRAAVTSHAAPSAIAAGITGLGHGTEAAAFLRDHLAVTFGLAPERVLAVDDMWLGYRALFAPGEGIVISAGTGSIGYHLTASGEVVRAGGHGVLLDDAGGGAWMAQAGLRNILRREDETPGSGWATPLGRRLGAAIGASTWDGTRAFVYGGDRGRLGQLARAVAEAAEDGDHDAVTILEDAGRELARLAGALRGRLGRKPVALIGRAALLSPRIAAAFSALVDPPLRIDANPPDIARAAALIALRETMPA